MTRVSLTPAPSDAGMPRSVWVTARGTREPVSLFMGRPKWGPGNHKTRPGRSAEHELRGPFFRAAGHEHAARVLAAVRDLADQHLVAIAVEVDAHEREWGAEAPGHGEHGFERRRAREVRGRARIENREVLFLPVRVEELAGVIDVAVDVHLDEARLAVETEDLEVLDVRRTEDQRLDDHFRLETAVVALASVVVVVDREPALDACAVDRRAMLAQDDLRARLRGLDAAVRRKIEGIDFRRAAQHRERGHV